MLQLASVKDDIINGRNLIIRNLTADCDIEVACELSERGKQMILAGGLLNFTKG